MAKEPKSLNCRDSATSVVNRERFMNELSRHNSEQVCAVLTKLVEWLATNGFGLCWYLGNRQTVQLRIGIVQDDKHYDTHIRVNPCGRVSSTHAEVRFQFDGMKGGPFRYPYMKYAIQKKLLLSGFPIHCGTTGRAEWDEEYFQIGDSHFFLREITDESLEDFAAVLTTYKQLFLDGIYAGSSLAVAAIIGAMAGSWAVFAIAAAVLIGCSFAGGDIRPGRRRR